MAYIRNAYGREIGEWTITKRRVESVEGYFEPGTRVKIIGKSERGYDLEDEYGNRIIETRFDSVE